MSNRIQTPTYDLSVRRCITELEHDYIADDLSGSRFITSEIIDVRDEASTDSSFLLNMSPSTRVALSATADRMKTFGRSGIIIAVERAIGIGGPLTGPCLALFIDENVSRWYSGDGLLTTVVSDVQTISRRATQELEQWRDRRRRAAEAGEESVDRLLEEGIPLPDLNRSDR